jgi:hypothetical protein
MENGNDLELETAHEERLPVIPPRGRQYTPVGSHDRAVIQMSSLEPGSTSASHIPLSLRLLACPLPFRLLNNHVTKHGFRLSFFYSVLSSN